MSREEPSSPTDGRTFFGGALKVLSAEGLLLPVGLLLTVFLTRVLGPSEYGLFVLASAVVFWIERAISAIFSRAGVRLLVASSERNTSSLALVSWQLLTGVGVALSLVATAGALAELLDEPALAPLLRLLALDIPLFCAARAYRTVMVSRLDYRRRALANAVGLTLRLTLVLALVAGGLGAVGAAAGFVGGSLAEVVYGARRIGVPRALPRPSVLAGFWSYAGPLALAAICTSLAQQLDLLLLSPLGVGPAEIGVYGAAHRSARAVLVLSAAAPLLLASVSDLWIEGRRRAAARRIEQGFAALLLLLPPLGVGAAAAPELVRIVFGTAYTAAAGPLALLLLAAFGQSAISLGVAALAAVDRQRVAAAIVVPIPFVAGVGHAVAIPRLGILGAATVAVAVAAIGPIGVLTAIRRLAGARFPVVSVLRNGIIALVGAVVVRAELPLPVPFVVQLGAALVVVALLVVGGERLRPTVRLGS